MTDLDAADSDLWRRLVTLSKTLGITIWPWEGMRGMLGAYSAPRPSTIHFTNRLDDRERNMALVHELGHASLHPPGSPNDPNGHQDDVEERAVNTAANEVCAVYGVHDYREAFANKGVTFKPVTAADPGRELVDTIVRRLTDALAHPETDPGWVPHD